MKKIIIFPGTFQFVKNYPYEGVDIWLESSSRDSLPAADYYIGHSGGANYILSNLDLIREGNFIFVNPLIRKRNIIVLLWKWIRFFIYEGTKMEKIVPPGNWWQGIKRVLKLLKVDVLAAIQKIPKERFTIIRGEKDDFFCDQAAADIIKKMGLKLIEVEAGHDWNEKIAAAVEKCLGER